MPGRDAYFAAYPLSHPAHGVNRIAGEHIRERATRHFSGRLLEIGCGRKAKSLLVGDLVAEHIGLDHDKSPHGRGGVDVVATALALPAADRSFDCILSTAVLEHIAEPQTALQEARRVLKPGGCAIYTVPLFWHLHEEPYDFFRYTRHGLEHLFRGAGFEILELLPLSGFLVTFGTAWSYYLQRFSRGVLAPLVRTLVRVNNLLFPWLDRGRLRDERFTWMYLVVARRPDRNGPIGRSGRRDPRPRHRGYAP